MTTDVTAQNIDTLLLEERRYPPPPEFAAQANAQPEIYERGQDLEGFWEREARRTRQLVRALRDSCSSGSRRTRSGFSAASSTSSYNCVDRHVEHGRRRQGGLLLGGRARRRPARDHLRRPASARSCASPTSLKKPWRPEGHAVGHLHGDGPRAARSRCSPARGIGAPHTVVFGGFTADSLSDRLNDMGCEVLITQDEAWRRGSTVPLKTTADEAMAARRA